MNLLSRISLSYILVSLLALAAGGSLFFVLFRNEVYEEVDEQLRDEKRNIERLLDFSDSIPAFYPEVNFQAEILPSESAAVKLQRKDTTIHHPYEGEIVFRQWRFTTQTDSGTYLVVLRKSLIDLGDLTEKIIYALVLGFLVLLAASAVANYVLLRITLRPFYRTLKQLRQFSLNDAESFRPAGTNTTEFRELNKVLLRMTERISADYKRTKEFTENASHEIQTPLAIIRNKLELLIQSEQLDQRQAELIQSAYEAASRLSALNQALILLTRIENKEFRSTEPVSMGDVMRGLVSQMDDRLRSRQLEITINETGTFSAIIDPSLASILLSNLLNNALRYTAPGSTIDIRISEKELRISNPGDPLPVDPEKLFERFFKISASSGSLGIGLSLARTISVSAGIRLNYSYSDHSHHFILNS